MLLYIYTYSDQKSIVFCVTVYMEYWFLIYSVSQIECQFWSIDLHKSKIDFNFGRWREEIDFQFSTSIWRKVDFWFVQVKRSKIESLFVQVNIRIRWLGERTRNIGWRSQNQDKRIFIFCQKQIKMHWLHSKNELRENPLIRQYSFPCLKIIVHFHIKNCRSRLLLLQIQN